MLCVAAARVCRGSHNLLMVSVRHKFTINDILTKHARSVVARGPDRGRPAPVHVIPHARLKTPAMPSCSQSPLGSCCWRR